MKNSILSILFLSVLLFVSCDDDSNNFGDDKANTNELREGDVMNKKDCFEFEYPIGIIFPDEKVINAEDEEGFYAAIKKWYKANPKEKEKPGLQYPLQVIFKGDISKTISSEKEMIGLKKYCDDKDGEFGNACFDMVYPISYEMPDGMIVSGENEKELGLAIKSWYEANSGSKEKPSLVYPVDVVLEDGSIVTINNEDDMIKLKKGC